MRDFPGGNIGALGVIPSVGRSGCVRRRLERGMAGLQSRKLCAFVHIQS